MEEKRIQSFIVDWALCIVPSFVFLNKKTSSMPRRRHEVSHILSTIAARIFRKKNKIREREREATNLHVNKL